MAFDLTTRYGGLLLRSPIVVGSCPLTAKEHIRLSLEAAGAGAIVLPSLFEEQVAIWNQGNHRRAVAGEQVLRHRGAKHDFQVPWHDADTYLSFVNRASVQSSVPVLASLNGALAEAWVDFAQELEDVGADGIELNFDLGHPDTYLDVRAMEATVCHSVAVIERAVDIPVFAKLGNVYTSLGHLARQLQSGVQGLVLFGQQPDVDIGLDDLRLQRRWGLTDEGSIVRSLRTIMQVHAMCPSMPIAASGGIASPQDVIKALLAGADVAMVTSAIYRDGPDAIRTLIDGLTQFMESKHLDSIEQVRQQRPLLADADRERMSYVSALTTWIAPEELPAAWNSKHGDRWGHTQPVDR